MHKNRKNEASRRLYQILLNICSPPPGAKLQRAAAKLLGINSRRGPLLLGCICGQQHKLPRPQCRVQAVSSSRPEDKVGLAGREGDANEGDTLVDNTNKGHCLQQERRDIRGRNRPCCTLAGRNYFKFLSKLLNSWQSLL